MEFKSVGLYAIPVPWSQNLIWLVLSVCVAYAASSIDKALWKIYICEPYNMYEASYEFFFVLAFRVDRMRFIIKSCIQFIFLYVIN